MIKLRLRRAGGEREASFTLNFNWNIETCKSKRARSSSTVAGSRQIAAS